MPAGARLEVTVNEVAVHVADTGDAESPAPPENEAWVTVFAGAQALDLAQVDATRAFLGSADAPAGKLTQVRLVLAADPTMIVDGVERPVACPSCTRSGLKIVPHGTLTVPEGGTLDLELRFDADASLGHDGEAWRLDPVLRL